MSISATGRNSPEYYFFKATMIPAAILMILFWQTTYRWLIAVGDRPGWQVRCIPTVGLVAALCLILYTTALGASGEIFRLERRIGVVIYFTFTYFAQLLLTRRVLLMNRITPVIPSTVYSCMFSLVTAVWVIGLVSLFLNIFYQNYELVDDAFEWLIALLIHLFFVVCFFAWRATGLEVEFSTRVSLPPT